MQLQRAGKTHGPGGQAKAAQFGERFKSMVRARLGNLAALGIATALALLPGASCAIAQGKGNKAPPAGKKQAPAEQKQAPAEQHRAELWYKLCNDVPVPDPVKPGEAPKQQKPEEMKKVNVCLTQADVRSNETAILAAKLAVRQVAGQPKPQLMVMLPLQSALQAGAFVKLDDKEPVRLIYTTCDRGGCYAEASIEPAMVDQMKSGKQIAFAGVDIAGHTLSVPLPLEGFAKAVDGPPLPPEKYIEEQRKIAEIIKARLAELRKKQEEAAQSGQNGQPPAAPANPTKKGK